jgi:hypothetical protein
MMSSYLVGASNSKELPKAGPRLSRILARKQDMIGIGIPNSHSRMGVFVLL